MDFTNIDQSTKLKTVSQTSHSTGGIGMALRGEVSATNNRTDSPVQWAKETTSTADAPSEMSATQEMETHEFKKEINKLKTEIAKLNSERLSVEMNATQEMETCIKHIH